MSFNEVVVEVRGLGKRYEIYAAPRDRLKQIFAGTRRKYYQEFWALNDVSFEVARGETVGIIGRNGSGKSSRRGRSSSGGTCPTSPDWPG